MRGGKTGPNYDARSIASAQQMLEARGLPANLIVDCSHANSGKDHKRQPVVFRDVMGQRASNTGIVGVMLESHLHEGNQTLGDDPSTLDYGVSITDACADWPETEALVREAFEALG